MSFQKLKGSNEVAMKNTNYVSNKDFLKLIIEYQETEERRIYNKIGKQFDLIARNLLNKTNFINYSKDRKDEMISDATMNMCRYLMKFDQTRSSNPFAYFTSCAWNSFRLNLNKHKKYNENHISLSFIENFDNNTDFTRNTINE